MAWPITREDIFWTIRFAVFLSLLWIAARAARGNEAETLLLLEQERAAIADEQQPKAVEWQEYDALHKAGFPDGAIVYVTAPNCAPCRALSKGLFSHKDFNRVLRHLVWTKPPPERWQRFFALNLDSPRVYPPFLVSVAPGGKVMSRIKCPLVWATSPAGGRELDADATAQAWIRIFNPDEENQ